jgi:DNA-binding response OmpR family regulator
VADVVLVADDLRDMTDSLADLLVMAGYEVVRAYDGADALSVAEREQPAVAVLDLAMPKLHGLEVCRAIRRQQWGAGTWCIALSAWTRPQDVQAAKSAGFDRFAVKPIRFENLLRLIGERPS